MGYRVIRLQVSNFLGIETLDQSVPDRGMVIAGRNSSGKTSCVKALRAALEAQGIGPECIRIGADRAEILVDLDAIAVRRVITAKGSTLTVTSRDGMRAQKPAAYLSTLLSDSALDPLDLYLAKPAERRAKILAALPVAITREDLARYLGVDVAAVPEGAAAGHGLDVLSREHTAHYETRKAANAAAKTAHGTLEHARAAVDLLPDVEAPSVADAQRACEEAAREVARVEARQAAAELAIIKGKQARDKAEALRGQAESHLADAATIRPLPGEKGRSAQALADLRGCEAEFAARLAAMRGSREAAEEVVRVLEQRTDRAYALAASAASLDTRAGELLSAVASTIDEPGPDEQDAAVDKRTRAEALRERAGRAEARRVAVAHAEAARVAHEAADAEAKRLDAIVRRLADDAPAELLARANGIPGLGVSGDSVTLDGKALDHLSGAEQLGLCVAISKRLSKAKLIVCDRAEAIDPETFDAFVREVTADGTQLICSRVERGALRFEAIELDVAPITSRGDLDKTDTEPPEPIAMSVVGE